MKLSYVPANLELKGKQESQLSFLNSVKFQSNLQCVDENINQ